MNKTLPTDKLLLKNIMNILDDHSIFSRRAWTISIEGGVAHITGTIPEAQDQTLLRKTIGGIKGVKAVWDILKIGGKQKPFIIDLGCGEHKQLGWALGIDRQAGPEVDITADIEKGIPFPNDSVDHVFAVHILEHIRDLIGVMNEIHRVLKPHGALHLITPCADCLNSVGDPTHVRFFNRKTIEFFCRSRKGLLPFRPYCLFEEKASLFADLTAVKDGRLADEDELSFYFD